MNKNVADEFNLFIVVICLMTLYQKNFVNEAIIKKEEYKHADEFRKKQMKAN